MPEDFQPAAMTASDAATSSPASESPSPEAVEAVRKLQEMRPNAGMSVSMALGTAPNPIHQKVNESHITLVLQTAKESSEHEFTLKQQQQKNAFLQSILDRIFEIILLAVFVGVIVFSIDTFKSQPAILTPMLTGVGGLFTGFLAGIGYGKKGGSK